MRSILGYTLTLLPAIFLFACGADDRPLETATSIRPNPACVFPMSETFGVADNFDPAMPDPVPDNPALPQFVSYLYAAHGIPSGNLKTFDVKTNNRHMVATLRHGLGWCFGLATSLTLCASARVEGSGAANDRVIVYGSDPSLNMFPMLYADFVVPTLAPTWNPGDAGNLCVDLDSALADPNAFDMLHYRMQDDSNVDVITLTLN